MAVTQGLGDGFALYNGVKLPNIDSVWTEELKETHPYAYIMDNPRIPSIVVYFLEQPLVYNSTGKKCRVKDGVAVSMKAYIPSDGLWIFYDEGEDRYSFSDPIVWASTDIFYESNSSNLYLSATSPLPLDGMQVIEWDGDTSGLTAHPSKANYYKAATGSVDAATAQAVLSDGTTSADGYLSEDGNIYLYSDGTKYTSLLAYTEAVAPKWTFNLQDLLSGMASAAASRGVLPRREPIAYLYNGVQLPGLPEWDKETYPYAWISKGQYSNQYTLHISTGLVNYRSWGDKGTLFYLYPISVPISVQQAYLSEDELDNGEWEFTWSKTYEENPVDSSSGFGLPIWSNFDVMNHYDSSTYLAASDPVPVYK